MKFEISKELAEEVVKYLAYRPFIETHELINAMRNLQPVGSNKMPADTKPALKLKPVKTEEKSEKKSRKTEKPATAKEENLTAVK